MSRGPVHEAFAALPGADAIAPALVRRKPPPPIAERVPRVAPPGNAQWIGGYWVWNDQLACWVWATGIWRLAPPGRHWVAGYWSAAKDGYRWVSGFWSGDVADRLAYLPAPPAARQDGSQVRVGRDEFRRPGSWQPADRAFGWQPASAVRFDPRRVWMPSQFAWTPAGFVYIAGYWDRPFAQRGWLFAPLGLTDSDAVSSSWVVTPDVIVNPASIYLELFARPARRGYYFGDYEGRRDRRYGIVPIAEYAQQHFEPIFEHLNWALGRQNPNWLRDAQAVAGHRPVQGFSGLTSAGAQARQRLVWLSNAAERAELSSRLSHLTPEQLVMADERARALQRQAGAGRADEARLAQQDSPPVVAARAAAVRSTPGPRHLHPASETDGLTAARRSGSTNLKPKSIVAHSGLARDDLDIDALGTPEDLTADSIIGSGLRLDIAPSLYGTAAVAGRSLIATGGGGRGLSSRAMIYNGLPQGFGNTFGGVPGITGGGVPSFPSGIGSGYQGGSPAGGINAPGGAYGLGSPGGGGGAFYGAGGGGTGHGSPGGGS